MVILLSIAIQLLILFLFLPSGFVVFMSLAARQAQTLPALFFLILSMLIVMELLVRLILNIILKPVSVILSPLNAR